MSIQIHESMARLGGEKCQEVAEVVKEWLDEVHIEVPESLSERVTITRAVFHAVVDGVAVVFQSDVKETEMSK